MFRRAVYALACVLALTLPVAAQEQTGQIQGSVKDTSGAVLPGVTVEIANVSTGCGRGHRRHRRQWRVPRAGPAPGQVRSHGQAAGLHAGEDGERRAAPRPDSDDRSGARRRRRHRDRVGHGGVADHRHQAERPQHEHHGGDVREAAEGPRLQHDRHAGARREQRAAVRRHLDRRIERVGEPLDHRRRRDDQPQSGHVGQEPGDRLRRRGPGQVVGLQRRIRRLDRRRDQRRHPQRVEPLPRRRPHLLLGRQHSIPTTATHSA